MRFRSSRSWSPMAAALPFLYGRTKRLPATAVSPQLGDFGSIPAAVTSTTPFWFQSGLAGIPGDQGPASHVMLGLRLSRSRKASRWTHAPPARKYQREQDAILGANAAGCSAISI